MRVCLRLARLSPGLPKEWSELMDEIRKIPFEQPGCKHSLLLVHVSRVLIPSKETNLLSLQTVIYNQ